MAMDYLAILATSMPCECANSVAGREFSVVRQSLSTEVFVALMYLRFWITGATACLKVPKNRAESAKAKQMLSEKRLQELAIRINVVEDDQDDWDNETADAGLLENLNMMHDTLLCDTDLD
jgi:hypothetical protein